MENLTSKTHDSKGRQAPEHLLGCRFTHFKNAKVYQVTGLVWLGDSDEWTVLHTRPGSDVVFARTVGNFLGNNADGQPRFVPET